MQKLFVLTVFTVSVFFVALQAHATLTNPITQGAITVKLTPFVTIPTADGGPQDLTIANDGTNRLFVATRNGKIDIVTPGATPSSAGTISPTPFLNVASAGFSIYTGGEGGFPGLAFSPNFATNGKFYTFDTENYPGAAPAADFSQSEMLPNGTLTPNNQILIREWTVSANPNVANTTSRILMRINHPQNNHQGGSLKFGPDGDLYIGLGDGGGGNDFNGSKGSIDGHNNTTGNGQDTSVVFGKILRIDPNGTNSVNQQYGIPPTNQFASGVGGLPEIYTYGMRNPYRFSFDSQTGHLLVGDVGQDTREEVDDVTAGGQGNYGWPYKEGTSTNGNWTAPGGFTSIAPIAEYQNSTPNNGGGDAVIGGFVYHGTLLPQLDGKYVFGDLDGAAGGLGKLLYTDPAGGGQIFQLKFDLTNGGVAPNSQLYGFGEDSNNELYALFANGQILHFVPEPASLSILATMGILLVRRRQ